MKISAKVGASTRLYMKFYKSQRVNMGLEKGYPARRVDPGWLLRPCKYLLQVNRRRVDPLRRVEANPGSCKGGLRVPLDEPGLDVNPGQLIRCGKKQVLFTRARVATI